MFDITILRGALIAAAVPFSMQTTIDPDQVLKQSSNPYDYKDQCPTFKCNDIEQERNSYTLYLDQ